jgi:alkylhydroperoxidase family enzyme
MFLAEVGDHVVIASHYRGAHSILVYRIEEMRGNDVILSLVAQFYKRKWHKPLPPELRELVKTAVARSKTRDYCHEDH